MNDFIAGINQKNPRNAIRFKKFAFLPANNKWTVLIVIDSLPDLNKSWKQSEEKNLPTFNFKFSARWKKSVWCINYVD